MSKINIQGIVNSIRTKSTYLAPIVEAVCNSIDAIGEQSNGKIDIVLHRHISQKDIEGNTIQGDFHSIDIIDNGVGFTNENRESFNTYRSDYKYKQGGKGFGRFMYLKYFKDVRIESKFRCKDDNMFLRTFTFGNGQDIIIDERIEEINNTETTKTILHLNNLIKTTTIGYCPEKVCKAQYYYL